MSDNIKKGVVIHFFLTGGRIRTSGPLSLYMEIKSKKVKKMGMASYAVHKDKVVSGMR